MKRTVYIWLPVWGRLVGGLGHAALEIIDDTGTQFWITWAAQGSPFGGLVEPMNKSRWDKLGQQEEDNPKRSYIDLPYETDNMKGFGLGPGPNHEIKLPGLVFHPGSKMQFGLDWRRVLKFWKKMLEEVSIYVMLDKKRNCTGCVTEALKTGSMGAYAEPPNPLVTQDAATLASWIEKAEKQVIRLNKLRKPIQETFVGLGEKYPFVNDGEKDLQAIPRLDEWIEKSNQGVNVKISSRIEQVAILDTMIEYYHSSRVMNSLYRDLIHYAVLKRMQMEVYSHLTLKPRSDRRQAVEWLGSKVLWVLNLLETKGCKYKLEDIENQRLYDQIMWLVGRFDTKRLVKRL